MCWLYRDAFSPNARFKPGARVAYFSISLESQESRHCGIFVRPAPASAATFQLAILSVAADAVRGTEVNDLGYKREVLGKYFVELACRLLAPMNF